MTPGSAGRGTCNVLFLCTGNSARSILAECLLNARGGDRFRGYSAGSFPTGIVHRQALALLRAQGLPTEGLASKSWDVFAMPEAPIMSLVITVCDAAAGEVCPVWPGQPATAHWGVADPASVAAPDATAAFCDAFRRLDRRIRRLVELPIETMDAGAIRRALDAIGRLP